MRQQSAFRVAENALFCGIDVPARPYRWRAQFVWPIRRFGRSGVPTLIVRLKPQSRGLIPVTDISELRTESDVEQKLVYPFLCHPSYLGLPTEWVRSKDYMEPTALDKGAGKRSGYVPDYSIWKSGFPLVIVEAKSPEERIELGLREARLYATEINKRYPSNINPEALFSRQMDCNSH